MSLFQALLGWVIAVIFVWAIVTKIAKKFRENNKERFGYNFIFNYSTYRMVGL